MVKSQADKLKILIIQSRKLDAKYLSNEITPRSFETRNKTIRTKINKILYS